MRPVSMSEFQIAQGEARAERITRRLLFVMLEDLSIDPTSRQGLHVIDHFRPDVLKDGDVDHAFTNEAILEFVKGTP